MLLTIALMALAAAQASKAPAVKPLPAETYFELRDLDRREELARQELRIVALERERLARAACGGVVGGCSIDLQRRVVVKETTK